METSTLSKIFRTFVLSLLPFTANAGIIGYNFEWTGANGFSMTGMFTFDEADGLDGAIRDGEVASLMFDGYLNGVLFASNSIAPSQAGFNFNFNTSTGQFFLNSDSAGDSGQLWNATSSTDLGFASGSTMSQLQFNLNVLGVINNPAPLTASLKATVPVPATILLFGLGLAGLGISRRKRTVKV